MKDAYVTWLRELRPRELDDVVTLNGAMGEPMFALREQGRIVPAPALSDGTLRFAALVAAFFQSDPPAVMGFEEIENGIHASRLRLVIEVLRSQSAAAGAQVLVTTHSPLVLAWLDHEEYSSTFLFRREDETGESYVVPLTRLPNFHELIDKQSIEDLFAEGWMEAVS